MNRTDAQDPSEDGKPEAGHPTGSSFGAATDTSPQSIESSPPRTTCTNPETAGEEILLPAEPVQNERDRTNNGSKRNKHGGAFPYQGPPPLPKGSIMIPGKQ